MFPGAVFRKLGTVFRRLKAVLLFLATAIGTIVSVFSSAFLSFYSFTFYLLKCHFAFYLLYIYACAREELTVGDGGAIKQADGGNFVRSIGGD